MKVMFIDDIKQVQSFKAGFDLVMFEAGTDPMDGFVLLGFDEVGMISCANPSYAWVGA
jgi:hypothetical protein|tara:strand:- start:2969 stop:3142 length:174 start_codon:yes stop_codon:yes gene_type:complete